jgi:outer membrane protein OmpA-like peptidoglycan-associated protein
MRTLLAALGLALLCGLYANPAKAADAEVHYVATNGGIDVRGHAQIEFYPAGKHDGPTVASAASGDTARMPEGTYNVHVTFEDGAAKKALWIDNQAFSGTVEKTVELALPIAEVRYVITNGGIDVHGHADVNYYANGQHDGPKITWANSGDSVRMPAGTYSVQMNFEDGAAKKSVWLDNQTFVAGTVEKTVEVGIPITEVRYVMTNGGIDVHGHANVNYYANGDHDGPRITWANSGESVRLPAGTYSVHVVFDDGDAHKQMWIDNQAFSGSVDKTVEIGLQITDVRYTITNFGVDVGDKGEARFFPPGPHDLGSITWATSGGPVRLPQGTYNVRVTFTDGDAHKEIWLDNQTFSGKVEKTVEVSVRTTDVRYVITNNGVDTGDKGEVRYFPAGSRENSIDWTNSDKTVRLPEGTYDVRVTFTDGDVHREKWLNSQAFAGKVDRTVEIGVSLTDVHYVITNGGVDVGQKGQVRYFPAGSRENSIDWTYSDKTVRLAEGTYNVRVTYDYGLAHKEVWLDNQAFSGNVDKTVELGITLAQPTVTVTRNGTDLGTQAKVSYLDQSDSHDFGTVPSGQAAVVEAGTYDIHASFEGTDAWLRKAAISGNPHLTIDLTPAKTDVMVSAMRGGNPLPDATCSIYAPGNDGAPLHSAPSGAWQEGPPGTYDFGCAIVEAGVTQRGLLKNQTIGPGKTELTVNFPAAPSSLALAAPASTAEPIAPDRGDFPYLPPVPGSRWASGNASTAPVYVQLPDAHQPELVANGSITKCYQAPGGVSAAALFGIYRTAAPKAGWTTVGEFQRADAGFTAHYGQNSRNIWAYLHFANDGYCISVADATISAGKLAADLGSQCHLALTGVLFDFNKSTLKPESDAVLQQVSAMMAGNPTLRLEVQGHTDAIGSDAYNQPLSQARARSVVIWLTQHGVAATQLTARGYGKTRPIASNATDDGRARNRRVEIASLGCVAQR